MDERCHVCGACYTSWGGSQCPWFYLHAHSKKPMLPPRKRRLLHVPLRVFALSLLESR